MDTKHDDGGPAYPRTGNFDSEQEAQFDCISQDGMTLWDFYAAAALQGNIARTSTQEAVYEAEQHSAKMGVSLPEMLASASAVIADAMIAERRKRWVGQ